MQIILEILAWIVFEFVGLILGASVRFAIFKIFNSSLKYNEFIDSESGSNDFYNFLVGIPMLCGLIFGIVYLIYN
ncbi:hypothetical protein [Algoriella sp.]|uniref:hypothetical protein n=1 Tax=Algoriella sp. TaxID=1872434 RepID=UPI002FCADBD5